MQISGGIFAKTKRDSSLFGAIWVVRPAGGTAARTTSDFN
jgi:hypothetical protein